MDTLERTLLAIVGNFGFRARQFCQFSVGFSDQLGSGPKKLAE